MRHHFEVVDSTNVDEIVARIHKTMAALEHTEFDYDDAFQWKALFWDRQFDTRSVVNVNLFLNKKMVYDSYFVEVHRLHGDSFGARFILYHLQREFVPGEIKNMREPYSIYSLIPDIPSMYMFPVHSFELPDYDEAIALSTRKCCEVANRSALTPCEDCKVRFLKTGVVSRMQTWLQETRDTFETRALKRYISFFLHGP